MKEVRIEVIDALIDRIKNRKKSSYDEIKSKKVDHQTMSFIDSKVFNVILAEVSKEGNNKPFANNKKRKTKAEKLSTYLTNKIVLVKERTGACEYNKKLLTGELYKAVDPLEKFGSMLSEVYAQREEKEKESKTNVKDTKLQYNAGYGRFLFKDSLKPPVIINNETEKENDQYNKDIQYSQKVLERSKEILRKRENFKEEEGEDLNEEVNVWLIAQKQLNLSRKLYSQVTNAKLVAEDEIDVSLLSMPLKKEFYLTQLNETNKIIEKLPEKYKTLIPKEE